MTTTTLMVMRPRTSWISAETWQLVDEKAARRRQLNPDQAVIRRLSRRIAASLRADRKRRVEAAGSAIESALQGKDLQEAWNIFKCWYRHAGDRAPRPSRQDLEKVTADRVALYTKTEPTGPPIEVVVGPADVSDDVPLEAEIGEAVSRLKRGKAPGPSGMRTDHVKDWLMAAEREETPDRTTWDCLVDLVRHVFQTGHLPH